MEEYLNDNVYVINLSHVKTPAEIIYDLSAFLDTEEARNKKVWLKLGEIGLKQSQLLSIKSLINSINSTLAFIETASEQTKDAASGLGIVLTDENSENPSLPEPEMTYKTIEEVINEFDERKNDEQIPPEYSKTVVTKNDSDEFTESTPRGYEPLEDHIDTDSENNEVLPESNNNEIQSEDLNENEQRSSHEDNNENITDSEEATVPRQEETINVPSAEEIKEELDTIFNSEKKLENMLENADNSEEDELKQHYTDILAEEKIYTDEDFELDSLSTKYIKQTIRSGQVINYDGHIIIIGDCHPGSEIVASGDITVWGVLSGIAQAGSKGNERARIRALNMNAIQLRIADCYARKPDALNTIFAEKTNSFVPEEARIVNGEIVIFKMND